MLTAERSPRRITEERAKQIAVSTVYHFIEDTREDLPESYYRVFNHFSNNDDIEIEQTTDQQAKLNILLRAYKQHQAINAFFMRLNDFYLKRDTYFKFFHDENILSGLKAVMNAVIQEEATKDTPDLSHHLSNDGQISFQEKSSIQDMLTIDLNDSEHFDETDKTEVLRRLTNSIQTLSSCVSLEDFYNELQRITKETGDEEIFALESLQKEVELIEEQCAKGLEATQTLAAVLPDGDRHTNSITTPTKKAQIASRNTIEKIKSNHQNARMIYNVGKFTGFQKECALSSILLKKSPSNKDLRLLAILIENDAPVESDHIEEVTCLLQELKTREESRLEQLHTRNRSIIPRINATQRELVKTAAYIHTQLAKLPESKKAQREILENKLEAVNHSLIQLEKESATTVLQQLKVDIRIKHKRACFTLKSETSKRVNAILVPPLERPSQDPQNRETASSDNSLLLTPEEPDKELVKLAKECNSMRQDYADFQKAISAVEKLLEEAQQYVEKRQGKALFKTTKTTLANRLSEITTARKDLQKAQATGHEQVQILERLANSDVINSQLGFFTSRITHTAALCQAAASFAKYALDNRFPRGH
jgi:hypothetical protein